jgi:hypothetical protein
MVETVGQGLGLDAVADLLVESEAPTKEIKLPANGSVKLVCGLVRSPNAETIYDVEVQELTGEHEELIAKSRRSPNIARFVSTILECGISTIGGEPAQKADIKKLLLGDREQLLMEIRRVTYGDELEFAGLNCPQCGELLDVTITLDDIPISRLESSEDRAFEVKLRKGGKAIVRLPNGEDQEAVLENAEATDAERNTVMLERCVSSLVDKAGNKTHVPSRPVAVRELSVPDRHAILDEVVKRQSGPNYNGVTFTHESCGKEVPLFLGQGDLFPHL